MDAPPVQYVRTSDGHDIAYTICGSGPPFLLYPPFFSHARELWTLPYQRRFNEAIAAHFTFVHFDHRGQGMSTRSPTGALSVSEYHADLQALVDGLQLKPLIMFATSYIAPLALSYAATHPDHVRAFIAWNGVFSRPKEGPGSPAYSEALYDWGSFVRTAAAMGRPHEDLLLTRRIFEESITQQEFAALDAASASIDLAEIAWPGEVPVLLIASNASARSPIRQHSALQLAAKAVGTQVVLFDDVAGGFDAVEGELSPVVRAIERFVADLPPRVVHRPFPRLLSPRETEVLQLLAAGRTNAQIAKALVISPSTVAKHVTSILTKTGTANRGEASAFAYKFGWN